MERVNKAPRLNGDEGSKENEKDEKVKVDDDNDELSDKLQSEILTKILDYLDEKQLVKCRLVNSVWNEISCLLLQDRTNKDPHSRRIVHLKENNQKDGLECTAVITKPLADFIDCFSPSEVEKSSGRRRPFPFCRFSFEIQQIYGNVSQVCEFVSIFGPHMKTVIMHINKRDPATFEKLWRLLLHFAPNIRHLIIHGDENLKYVNLFDPIGQFIAKSCPNFQVLNPKDSFMKNLKVLEIDSIYFGRFNGFMKALLDNAPNLQDITPIYSKMHWENNGLKNLAVWKKLGKAHLFKHLYIKFDAKSEVSPVKLMKNLQLESLHVTFCGIPSDYIYHALKSNRETLSSLNMYGVTAKNMELCLKDLKSLPNLRQLQIRLEDLSSAPAGLDRVSQICPNVTSLKLWVKEWSFSQAAPILWTRFKGLKSLYVSIIMYNGKNDSMTLDSVISGYSTKSIARIQTKLNQGISLKVARRKEKQNPSVLDLKGLSRLQLELNMGKRSDKRQNVENELRNSIFVKMLPQHIRENPRTILYSYMK